MAASRSLLESTRVARPKLLLGSPGSGTAAIAGDQRMAEVNNRLAGGLQASADWIREADVDSMRTGIETQVKEHPGRTLLIAAGLGYLLGKAFRR